MISFPKRTGYLLFLIPAVIITYSTIFTSGRLPGGELSDTVSQGYPFFTYTAESLQEGTLPHWNPYVFCGIPFYSSFSAPVFYPIRGLLLLIAGVEGMIRFLFPIQMLLGGIFAWLFLGSLGVSRWGRIAGSLAYAVTAWSNTLFYAGHGSKIICWSFLPLLLYSCEMWMQTRRGKFIAIGGMAIGMQTLASHPQMVLYSVGAAIIWLGFRIFSNRGSRWKNLGRAVMGITIILLLAAAIGAIQLLPGYNFSHYSTRGGDLSLDQASSYSLPPEETLTMLFPHLFGYRHGFPNSTVSGVPLYFGRLGLRLSSEFTGILVFLLASAAFLGFSNKYRWPLLGIMVTGLLISWGGYTPVFKVLYSIVPFLRKLRAPHMAAFLTTSAIALAAGPGFDAIFRSERFPGRKFLIGISVFAGVCILIFLLADSLLPGLQSGWWTRMGNSQASGYASVVNRRVDIASPDFLRAAAAALILAGLIYFRNRGKAGIVIPGVTLSILIAVEVIPLDRDFQFYLNETSVDALFMHDSDLITMTGSGRLLPGGNEFVPLHIRSVSGYHAAKTAVAEDLQNMMSSGGIAAIRQTGFSILQTQDGYLTYAQFRDYLIEQTSTSDPSYADTLKALLPLESLPRVWFAESWMELSENQCLSLLSAGINPREITILYESPELSELLDTEQAEASIVIDEPHRVTIQTDNSEDGLLVLADTWYPRWTVFIDGEPAEMIQSNHWQRGVVVPSGLHEVEYIFDSSDVTTGLILSVAGLLSAFLIIVFDVTSRRLRKKTTE
ncbi:MAG: hypothetical protein KAR44_13690 [Candidatus Aegiribacteria sp.]|nr:hypothetical protein [Candidatus Aegiribacteria sp.]